MHSPSIICPQSTVEGRGHVSKTLCRALKPFGEILGVTLSNGDDAPNHDDKNGDELGRGEDILHLGSQRHRVRVDEGDEDCDMREER